MAVAHGSCWRPLITIVVALRYSCVHLICLVGGKDGRCDGCTNTMEGKRRNRTLLLWPNHF